MTMADKFMLELKKALHGQPGVEITKDGVKVDVKTNPNAIAIYDSLMENHRHWIKPNGQITTEQKND